MANYYPPSGKYVKSLAVSFNGTDWYFMPPFWDYKMTSTTIVDSSRNAKAEVVSNIIREGIRKIELNWQFLDRADFSYVAKLFEDASVGGNGAFMFYVKYFDTIRNALIDSNADVIGGVTKERKFYINDRVSDTAKIKLDELTGFPIGYTNVKLSFIEV